ncbi:methyltransferase [Streptomyces sp. ME19-01-6]|uniref:methyltransferase n=1 Tax=Streptomyces sp. ME19-01-6 TaxID=3028686 RepID=UPI0029A92E86|nr:methyltransferase [Streptomyces sp. ME19-01-6]MDX3228661.1 methyltransferase [Streptomyces sp. ME19-01-6]
MNAPALFNAVATAVECDIFRFLDSRPDSTLEEIQAATGLPAHQLRVLLQAVCVTGLLRRENGRYANSDAARDLLVPDGPDSWRHILIGWKEVYYPAFGQMTTALRAGTNTALAAYPGDEPTLYQRLSHQPEREALFHAAMSAFTLRSLPALLDHPELSSVRHLLDVGGGDATTTSHLVRRHPDLRVTVFDLPSVSGLAEDTTADLGDRVRHHPGDLFKDDFPTGVDGVLFSHVLEIFSGEQIVALLTKAHQALPPGGRVFVYGYNVSDDETAGIFSARLSLYLNVLASGQGMAYPARDYEDWLRTAGFQDVRTTSGLPYEHGLTYGVKR